VEVSRPPSSVGCTPRVVAGIGTHSELHHLVELQTGGTALRSQILDTPATNDGSAASFRNSP
jgi:hypothetical protein